MRRLLLGLILGCWLIVGAWPSAAQSPTADKAVDWIRTQQQADGSFAGLGLGSTADALYALVAANVKADDVTVNGSNAQQFIEANVSDIAAEPGLATKYIMAELLSGHDPRNVAGVDLVAALSNSFDGTTGMYGADLTTHALALLALNAAGADAQPAALTTLLAAQLDDGSWSFTGDRTPDSGDTNTTALAVHALVASDQQGTPALSKALDYLQTQQNSDGGFPYSQASAFGTASDANSTALVIQAIVAAGESPDQGRWTSAEANPLQALQALQNASGAFRYDASTPDDNAFATYQAVPALLLTPYPLEQIAIVQQPAPAPTPTPAPPVNFPNTGAATPSFGWTILVGAAVVLSGVGLRRRARRTA